MSRILRSKDLHLITSKLLPAKNKWREIGDVLGLPPFEIEAIHSDNPQREMLAKVLQIRSLTWEVLIDALRVPVSQKELANDLAKIHGEFSNTCPMPAGTVLLQFSNVCIYLSNSYIKMAC